MSSSLQFIFKWLICWVVTCFSSWSSTSWWLETHPTSVPVQALIYSFRSETAIQIAFLTSEAMDCTSVILGICWTSSTIASASRQAFFLPGEIWELRMADDGKGPAGYPDWKFCGRVWKISGRLQPSWDWGVLVRWSGCPIFPIMQHKVANNRQKSLRAAELLY